MKFFSHYKRCIKLGCSACFLLLLCTNQSLASEYTHIFINDILQQFKSSCSVWTQIFTAAATRLFWSLVTISMVWTFGAMALRKADIGEFFAEFIRFLLFVGFHWWILLKAPYISKTLIDSLRMLAGQANNMGKGMSPGDIADLGFHIVGKACNNLSFFHGSTLIIVLLSFIILGILVVIAANMTLLLVSTWIVTYGGLFFLGFGGSKWTSDIAINYYRSVLGLAVQLMGMTLLVGIGQSIMEQSIKHFDDNSLDIMQMASLFTTTIMLLYLVNKVPNLLAGVITGASLGHGIGNFGGSTVMNTAPIITRATYSAGAPGAALLSGTAKNVAGVSMAASAGFKKAQQNYSASYSSLSSTTPLTAAMGTAHRAGSIVMGTLGNMANGGAGLAKEAIQNKTGEFLDKARETIPGRTAEHIKKSMKNDDTPKLA